ncbi:MAG: S8 family serine peptidase [Promethearchaeota archaeon]
MTQIKKITNLLIFTFILFTYFVIPFIGIQLNNLNPYNPRDNDEIKLKSAPSSSDAKFYSYNSELDGYKGKDKSKFDIYLTDYLVNITYNLNDNPSKIKIIVHFENSLSKEERIKVLDSIFTDYKLITNYDIISGIYLEIKPYELIENGKSIESNSAITKICKSKNYQYPYFQEDNLQLSALDEDFYSNWWLPAIGAEDLPYNGSGVKVAVIDTGIYPHPDLTIVNNSNFVLNESISNFNDDIGHGTHVAGIIAGDGGGSSGKYRGVAPGALLINARAGNASGLQDGDIIKAIQWASKPTSEGGAGADIISMSFGGGFPGISDSITEAITNAKDAYGVIFVASAGNYGPDYFTGSTPASGIDVIAVGATARNDNLASFSSWGPTFSYIGYPDVVAPGVNIISTEAPDSVLSDEYRYLGDYFDFPGDADYIPLSGTSMACPIVSGALAILLEAYPNITAETARIALLEGARKIDNKNDILKSGAGLINVSASLNYLSEITPNYNDILKIYPDDLPVKPFDLLHFPGDHQKFNLTIISGENKTVDIDIPTYIQGVSISLDKSNIVFNESGIEFVELDIEINNDATPGLRNFQINLTVGGYVYDFANISLNIRLPEYKILMESYHGLNDWFPEFSFNQLGFYDAMDDLTELNISIDYSMEYWTPDYNRDFNNSILTEEKLAQYDIIALQAPILPYSAIEIENIKNYFENGGNILFLGTRYQDMAVENINNLFAQLGADLQINEENIMNDSWLGDSISVSSQSVNNLNNVSIFSGVDKFYWLYGNSFTTSGSGESLATIDNKTVVARYDGQLEGKGRLLAFGDLHWMFDKYSLTYYIQDHYLMLKNIIEYFLIHEDISINIYLKENRISNQRIDLSLYLKNQTSGIPITPADYDSLNVFIKNATYSKPIILNVSHGNDGIYYNDSFTLPFPSYIPYSIKVSLSVGLTDYNKTTKILYFDSAKIPKITSLYVSNSSVSREPNETLDLITELDKPSYGDIEGYLSIYPFSFYNTKQLEVKDLLFSHSNANIYLKTFDPLLNDPSGYGIYYIIPQFSNYSTPNSPRVPFQIINHPPEILEEQSVFNYPGSSSTTFKEAENYIYPVKQLDEINFVVDVQDSVDYEDTNSEMRVFVNLFIGSLTPDNYVILISPSSNKFSELSYQSSLDRFEGSITIPYTIQYSTISGIKSISTKTNFNTITNEGYIGILVVTVYDSEGEAEDFWIAILISEPPINFSMIIIVIVSIVALIGVVSMIIYYARRKKHPRVSPVQPSYQELYYRPSYEDTEKESYITPEPISQLGQFYCPFCGQMIKTPKKFCPHCGESLMFEEQDD